MAKQRDTELARLVLRYFPSYGEQIVLVVGGEEVGSEIVGQDLDGFGAAVRTAARELLHRLPDPVHPGDVAPVSYVRRFITPHELEIGYLVEVGDTGKVAGEVADIEPTHSLSAIVNGLWADGREFTLPLSQGLWVRVTN